MSGPILQGRVLWCDAEANCRRMSTREGVAEIVRKAERARINTIVVDVKPLVGEVLYPSRYAPRLGEVEGFVWPESFDLLAAMVEEGHARGISIHAGVNIFSEGYRDWGRGPAYDHPEWQVTMYEAARTVGFSGDESVSVDRVDPWEEGEYPAIYTRKSGCSIQARPGRRYIVIRGKAVSAVACEGEDVPVPEDGCVLSLPYCRALDVSPGDAVTWQAEPVFRPAAESCIPSWGIFVNPIGPAAKHELRVLEEIVSGYDIDGITFDRMRYPNLYADFGQTSRAAFEEWLGRGSIGWPEDIFRISDMPWEPPAPGVYYKEWLEWRAWQIRNFAANAAGLVRSIRPEVKVGVYVGSWYESYYDMGVNWGSCDFHAGYEWMTPEYNRTGYAELFDYICTGCYYPLPTREDARACGRPEGATVESACWLSRKAIGEASLVYGSLYLRDYNGRPEDFRRALDTALNCSDGVMLFDLVYLEEYGWWPIVEQAFAMEAVTPHDAG